MNKVDFRHTTLLKITKIREHRINFRYDGVLFTLNEHCDCFEYVLRLKEKETGKILISSSDSLNIRKYIKMKYKNDYNEQRIVYSHIDKEYFINRLKELEENEN